MDGRVLLAAAGFAVLPGVSVAGSVTRPAPPLCCAAWLSLVPVVLWLRGGVCHVLYRTLRAGGAGHTTRRV